MTNATVNTSTRSSLAGRGVLILLTTFLAACPSEPNSEPALEPMTSSNPGTATGESAIDEVDVVSPEEALDEATAEIDSANVLDELNALEGEIQDD